MEKEITIKIKGSQDEAKVEYDRVVDLFNYDTDYIAGNIKVSSLLGSKECYSFKVFVNEHSKLDLYLEKIDLISREELASQIDQNLKEIAGLGCNIVDFDYSTVPIKVSFTLPEKIKLFGIRNTNQAVNEVKARLLNIASILNNRVVGATIMNSDDEAIDLIGRVYDLDYSIRKNEVWGEKDRKAIYAALVQNS